jgi:hypothetical protein
MQIRRHVLLYTELVECSDVTDIDCLCKIYSLLKDQGNDEGDHRNFEALYLHYIKFIILYYIHFI